MSSSTPNSPRRQAVLMDLSSELSWSEMYRRATQGFCAASKCYPRSSTVPQAKPGLGLLLKAPAEASSGGSCSSCHLPLHQEGESSYHPATLTGAHTAVQWGWPPLDILCGTDRVDEGGGGIISLGHIHGDFASHVPPTA